jgi:hypothetical protein
MFGRNPPVRNHGQGSAFAVMLRACERFWRSPPVFCLNRSAEKHRARAKTAHKNAIARKLATAHPLALVTGPGCDCRRTNQLLERSGLEDCCPHTRIQLCFFELLQLLKDARIAGGRQHSDRGGSDLRRFVTSQNQLTPANCGSTCTSLSRAWGSASAAIRATRRLSESNLRLRNSDSASPLKFGSRHNRKTSWTAN